MDSVKVLVKVSVTVTGFTDHSQMADALSELIHKRVKKFTKKHLQQVRGEVDSVLESLEEPVTMATPFHDRELDELFRQWRSKTERAYEALTQFRAMRDQAAEQALVCERTTTEATDCVDGLWQRLRDMDPEHRARYEEVRKGRRGDEWGELAAAAKRRKAK